jgi:hypothetical protein
MVLIFIIAFSLPVLIRSLGEEIPAAISLSASVLPILGIFVSSSTGFSIIFEDENNMLK